MTEHGAAATAAWMVMACPVPCVFPVFQSKPTRIVQMDRFHLFFDDEDHAIVIEDHPDAIDRAPYDRMDRRAAKMVDAGLAEILLREQGGVGVYADRLVEIERT